MWNGEGDDPVPVMDDFNREKRIFTVAELRTFVKTSLTNYYAMFGDDNDEFEQYIKHDDAAFFYITMDPGKQPSESIPLVPQGDSWPDPFDLDDADLKEWLSDKRELQISFQSIDVQYPPTSGREIGCYSWNVT